MAHLLSHLNRIVQMKMNYHVEFIVTRLEESVFDVLQDYFDCLVIIGNILKSIFMGIKLTRYLSPRNGWSNFYLV